jgi:hypothetical protein
MTERSDLAEEWRQAFAAAHPGEPIPEPSPHDLLHWMDWTEANVARLLEHLADSLTPAQWRLLEERLTELGRDMDEGRTVSGRLQ